MIVNPKSAGGDTRDKWASIAADMRAHFGPFQASFTKRIGDGTRIAREAANKGRRLIISCGGDGTANEVVNGIMESDSNEVEMGVMPSGTGGDFRRSIKMPNESREAAKALRTGVTKSIDIGKVVFTSFEGAAVCRYFLNISSFGLSADINRRVSGNTFFKWLPLGNSIRGRAKFAFSTIQEVLDIEPVKVAIAFDGSAPKTLQTLNFCICNGRYFGGGMKIAPNSKLSDGEFDIVNIGDINTVRIFRKGYKLYNGSHLDLPEVKIKLVRSLTVNPTDKNEKIPIELDGEIPGYLPAKYEVLPKALKMRIPL